MRTNADQGNMENTQAAIIAYSSTPAFFTRMNRVYSLATSVNAAIVKKVIPVAVPAYPLVTSHIIDSNDLIN
jgi:hypothetical protein